MEERLSAERSEVDTLADPLLFELGITKSSNFASGYNSLISESGHRISQTFTSLHAATAWHRRVGLYVDNMRRDLEATGVPAPGRDGCRWLLYDSDDLSIGENGTISCRLCRVCAEAFSRTHGKDEQPVARMPAPARANGLWRGPDPPELACLSYCEAKVINLARVYVSVKRVFLDRSSYAATTATEAPLYHQKNVVAYPQNPDAALCALGMSRTALAKMVVVQFVGENCAASRRERDQRVSVNKSFVLLFIGSPCILGPLWRRPSTTKYGRQERWILHRGLSCRPTCTVLALQTEGRHRRLSKEQPEVHRSMLR